MWIKLVIIILLLVVMVNLFHALFTMLKNNQDSPKMSHYLGRRLMFSVIVVALLLLAMATGVIKPHHHPFSENKSQTSNKSHI